MISIVIPCYNHGQALVGCLDSLRHQGIDDYEIIIINDCSNDDTESVVKKYIATHLNFKIKYFSIAHAGAPVARNTGAKYAQGNYIMFADADLIFSPGAINKLLKELKKHPDASYAYSGFRFGWKKFNCQPFSATALKQGNYIHTSALIRRERFLGFDENLRRFQDWDLWLTMLEHGFIGVFVPEILFQARVTRLGISSWRPRFWHIFWSFLYHWIGLAPKSFIGYVTAKKTVQLKHGLI